jgi:uncharacterized membrane protein YqjE
MASHDQPITSLLSELMTGVSTLLRQELRLAQAESSEKLSQAMTALVALFVGLLLAFCALLVLLQALVLALSDIMPPAYAALVVGGAVALVAFILIQQGQSRVRIGSLAPERTMKAMREDREMVMDKVR